MKIEISNKFIRSCLGCKSLIEMKTLYATFGIIDESNEEQVYFVSKKELMNMIGQSNRKNITSLAKDEDIIKSFYSLGFVSLEKDLRASEDGISYEEYLNTKLLFGKNFNMSDVLKETISATSIFSRMSYSESKKKFIIGFNKDFIKYNLFCSNLNKDIEELNGNNLIKIDKVNYTVIDLNHLGVFKSKYMLSFFLLLSSYKNIRSDVTITLNEIRHCLGVEWNFSDIKDKVLKNANQFFAKTDIAFEIVSENKKGKSVVSITFKITKTDVIKAVEEAKKNTCDSISVTSLIPDCIEANEFILYNIKDKNNIKYITPSEYKSIYNSVKGDKDAIFGAIDIANGKKLNGSFAAFCNGIVKKKMSENNISELTVLGKKAYKKYKKFTDERNMNMNTIISERNIDDEYIKDLTVFVEDWSLVYKSSDNFLIEMIVDKYISHRKANAPIGRFKYRVPREYTVTNK